MCTRLKMGAMFQIRACGGPNPDKDDKRGLVKPKRRVLFSLVGARPVKDRECQYEGKCRAPAEQTKSGRLGEGDRFGTIRLGEGQFRARHMNNVMLCALVPRETRKSLSRASVREPRSIGQAWVNRSLRARSSLIASQPDWSGLWMVLGPVPHRIDIAARRHWRTSSHFSFAFRGRGVFAS